MELKVLCDCGQKYAFDVEPIANQMPFIVNCPSCGKDGTSSANLTLARTATNEAIKPLPSIRLSVPSPAAVPTLSVKVNEAPPPVLPQELKPAARPWEKADMTEVHSLGLGIVGAVAGAIVGVALLAGFYKITGIAFPMVGTAVGALTGFGARWLYKGTDVTLGIIAGVIALLATGGIFFVLFGIFAIINLISLFVSVSIAYKVAG